MVIWGPALGDFEYGGQTIPNHVQQRGIKSKFLQFVTQTVTPLMQMWHKSTEHMDQFDTHEENEKSVPKNHAKTHQLKLAPSGLEH
jgi:hypothetical protein